MGKGDKRTKKGKIILGSSGVTRQKKKVSIVIEPKVKKAAPKKPAAKKAAPKKKAAAKK